MLTEHDLLVSFNEDTDLLKVSLPPYDCLGVSLEDLCGRHNSIASDLKNAINNINVPQAKDYFIEDIDGYELMKLQDELDNWDESLREILLDAAEESFQKRVDTLLSFLPQVFMYGVEAGRREAFASKGKE